MDANDILSPLEASKFISERATDVVICQENIKKVADLVLRGMSSGGFNRADWKKLDVNPKVADESALSWIFFVDTLNFSFWTPVEKKYEVTYKNNVYTGYFSLCAAVQRALENNIPLTDPSFYSSVSMETLKQIFRSDNGTEMPLMEDRLAILHQTGKELLGKFGGSFANCVKAADGSALRLVQLVVQHFPSYRDEAVYEGRRVAFYKRAQILVADIWACFEGANEGNFADIDSITMFADYRIPQVLAYFEILKYSTRLDAKLRQEELMKSQEKDEVEIRGCTIWAVELIKDELRKMEPVGFEVPINSITVDFFLWEFRRKHPEVDITTPYHRVRCVYY